MDKKTSIEAISTKYPPKEKQFFFGEILFGALHPFYAIGYILKTPSLWKFLIFPCLIMMVVMITSITLIYLYVDAIQLWVQSIIWEPDHNGQGIWNRALLFLYDWGIKIALVCIGIFGGYGIGLSVAPIFSEGISDSVAQREGWFIEQKQSIVQQSKNILLSVFESLLSLIVYLIIM